MDRLRCSGWEDAYDLGDDRLAESAVLRCHLQVFENPNITVGGKQYDSVTDDFCDSQKTAFNDTNDFEQKGGMKAMGKVRATQACIASTPVP